MIQNEEDAYQAQLEKKEQKEQEKQIKVIKNKPVSFRTLTGNKTYSIRSEKDIDKVLDELKAGLREQLEEDTVIKLS